MHFRLESADRLNLEWSAFSNADPVWTTIIILAALIAPIAWKRRAILNWLRNHKTTLAVLAVGCLFDSAKDGKTYTAIAGAGGSDYDARLAANQIAVKYLAVYCVGVLAYSFAAKLIRAISERRKNLEPAS